MRIEFLLLLVIIAINCHPFLRNLADTEKVTKESCEKDGKKYEEVSATCTAGKTTFDVTKQSECVQGKWTEGVCSISTITEKNQCTGNPVYTAAQGEDAAKCTLTLGDGTKIEITDSESLSSEDKCQKQLEWKTTGTCSNSAVKNKEDCETANPKFTEATGKCVEKETSATSFNTFLSFKFGLILIYYLLF